MQQKFPETDHHMIHGEKWQVTVSRHNWLYKTKESARTTEVSKDAPITSPQWPSPHWVYCLIWQNS